MMSSSASTSAGGASLSSRIVDIIALPSSNMLEHRSDAWGTENQQHNKTMVDHSDKAKPH
jgi:hypothetical protein